MSAISPQKLMFITVLIAASCCLCKAAETVLTTTPATTPHQVGRSSDVIKQANIALKLAVEGNNSVAAQAAIDKGANLEKKDVLGWTVLHNAAWEGYAQVIDVLLKAGANVEAETMGRNRPLHLAAWKGRDEAVSRLVKAGADLHAVGSLHQTALEKADYYTNQSTVKLLRSLGAQQ